MLFRSATPRRDADGHVTMWIGGATDIHEQRQMVQEVLEANEQQAALSEQAYQQYQQAENQRETYHNLFMDAPAMIAITRGPEHRYEFVNPAYQQLFPHRQLVGRTVAEAVPEIKEQGFIDILDKVRQVGIKKVSFSLKPGSITVPTGAVPGTNGAAAPAAPPPPPPPANP